MNPPSSSSTAPGPAGAGAGEMMSWIRQIVGFGTRRPGYPQGLAVEGWLAQTFRQVGLEEIQCEPVPVNYWEPSLTVLSLPEQPLEVPCFPVPYTAWTPGSGLTAPLAFLGEGSAGDLEAADVRGRIVVLEARFAELSGALLRKGALFERDVARSIPDGPLHVANWLIRNFPAYDAARQRGAVGFVGLLVDSPVDGSDYYVPYDGQLKGLPGVWVGREHAACLRELAQAGATACLTSLGEGRVVSSHNVLGVIPGTGQGPGREKPNENILVTCHHDAPFASAVEDASGLAALLALAKEFAEAGTAGARLRRDLVFVAASGHFHGGLGNRVLVEKHTDGFLKRTVAAFGVEHIAEEAEGDGQGGYRLTGRPEVRALFFDGSQAFLRALEAAADRTAIDRLLCVDAYLFGPEPPCDSAPFFTAGIPSACHITGPLYLFDPHDTIDKVRIQDLVPVTRFFAHAIRTVDAMSAEQLAQGMQRLRGAPPPPLPPWFRSFER